MGSWSDPTRLAWPPPAVPIGVQFADDGNTAGDTAGALAYAEQLAQLEPDDPGLYQLHDGLNRELSGNQGGQLVFVR
jgi:hypothetical protein